MEYSDRHTQVMDAQQSFMNYLILFVVYVKKK